jgi:hypothetical protein
VIGIERVSIDRRGEVSGTRHVANVRLEILDLIEDRRVIEQALLISMSGLNVELRGTLLRGPALNCQTTPSVKPLK